MKWVTWVWVGFLVCGCAEEEVRTVEVPKEIQIQPAPVKMMSTPLQVGFEADLPEGWQIRPGQGMRVVSYAIEHTQIDFYIIKLGMGDLTSNVNRWRGQLDLPEASAEAIAQAVKPLMAGSTPVQYVELYNEDKNKGILAAIADRSPSFWYFTAKGSVDELQAHASDIQRFINSIRFE